MNKKKVEELVKGTIFIDKDHVDKAVKDLEKIGGIPISKEESVYFNFKEDGGVIIQPCNGKTSFMYECKEYIQNKLKEYEHVENE